MKSLTRSAVIAVALALLAGPALAQRHAQPRSGSSGSPSTGGRSSAPGGRSAPSASPTRPSGQSSAVSRGTAHRDPGSVSSPHRPPGRRPHDGGRGHFPYYPYYYPRYSFGFGFYSPYYYSPYYYPYYYPSYYGPYHYGYPYSSPYYPYHRRYAPYGYGAGASAYYERQDLGAVALRVKPKSSEVYIDGRYVGATGSFDGFPGYLWLEPGAYDLVVVHEGYANLEQEIEITPGHVLEIETRLARGEAQRPEAETYEGDDLRPPPYRDGRHRFEEEEDRYRDGRYRDDRYRDDRDRDRPRDLPPPDQAGLVFEVRPDDASVYVDGRFVGTAAELAGARTPFPVEPGEHTIEVVHPGFETAEREITVRAGDERLVDVALRRAGR